MTKCYCSEKEVSEQLRKDEEKWNLLRYQVDGWCVWPLLRFSISRDLQNIPCDYGKADGLSRKELIQIALRDISRLILSPTVRYIVKSRTTSHQELENELKKDIYLDDILRSVGNYYKIEHINNRSFYFNGIPQLIRSNISTLICEILSGRLSRISWPKYIDNVAENLSKDVKKAFGLKKYSPARVASYLRYFYWGKIFYRFLLKRLKPKYLLLDNPGDYPITAAAKEIGIKVIEFQHGVATRHYPPISWGAYALKHKAKLAIPDRIFLYGNYWKQEWSINGFWNDELVSVGSCRLDKYRKIIRPKKNTNTCKIVLTTQGVDTNNLIKYIKEFNKRALGRLKFKLFIKLHPQFDRNWLQYEVAFAQDANIQIIPGSESPTTFELLTAAHFHVSIYSACHYEALALGIPTIIIPLVGYENVKHLYETGHALLAKTPHDLLCFMRNHHDYRPIKKIRDYYFRPNALVNISRQLKLI